MRTHRSVFIPGKDEEVSKHLPLTDLEARFLQKMKAKAELCV